MPLAYNFYDSSESKLHVRTWLNNTHIFDDSDIPRALRDNQPVNMVSQLVCQPGVPVDKSHSENGAILSRSVVTGWMCKVISTVDAVRLLSHRRPSMLGSGATSVTHILPDVFGRRTCPKQRANLRSTSRSF